MDLDHGRDDARSFSWVAPPVDDTAWPVAHKVAAYVPVSREVLIDNASARDVLVEGITRSFDRLLHPWRYPDRCPFPTFDLFPRLSRLARKVRRA